MNNIVTCEITQGIAVVKIEDRQSHNTFSPEVIDGLGTTFNQINSNNDVKCVVIHGYDNYFCCGGTKEELLAMYSGQMTFVDLAFYRLLLDCPIPTIAAMQGHALGGGLAFAMYADIIIMAEENIYSANFMKYGFTPGMGATYMLPLKLGRVIGEEMLYSADTFYGENLKKKGTPITIVKKASVISTAMDIAKTLNDKPRICLELLKNHLTQDIKEKLPKIIEAELQMHKITFSTPEVKKRIENLFGK